MSPSYTITPDDIRAQEFRTRMRGYDPDQVRSYLEELADQVQYMRAQMRDLRNRLNDAQQQLDSAVGGGESTDTAIPVQRFTEQYRQEAEADAHGLVNKARTEADSIIAQAQAQVEDLKREIADLNTLRERIISQIDTLLRTQLEHLHRFRGDSQNPEKEAPEAPPILANLDDTMPPR
ncbi:MAG: hypothetical protein Kow0074_02750 [Candidatus Zixiibacteriota bacterium]